MLTSRFTVDTQHVNLSTPTIPSQIHSDGVPFSISLCEVIHARVWLPLRNLRIQQLQVGLRHPEQHAFRLAFDINREPGTLMFLGAFIIPAITLLYGPLLGSLVAIIGSLGPAFSAKNVKVAEVFAKVA